MGQSFLSFSDASFSGLLKEIQRTAYFPEALSTFFSSSEERSINQAGGGCAQNKEQADCTCAAVGSSCPQFTIPTGKADDKSPLGRRGCEDAQHVAAEIQGLRGGELNAFTSLLSPLAVLKSGILLHFYAAAVSLTSWNILNKSNRINKSSFIRSSFYPGVFCKNLISLCLKINSHEVFS